MIIQADFGEAVTNLGYQFYEADGTLLATRITAGISTTPITGGYSATATVPANSVGVFWDSTEAEAAEDLREALALEAADQILLSTAYVPDAGPTLTIPSPADDADLCRVYVWTEDLSGVVTKGVVVTFEIDSGAVKTDRALTQTSQTMTTNSSGYAQIDLQRTDEMTPAGRGYLVTCAALGMRRVPMTLEATTFDLKTLIS